MSNFKSLGLGLLCLLHLLSACSEDPLDPASSPDEGGAGLHFTATVVPSQAATRADGSLINRLETSLFETRPRTYWVKNQDGDLVATEDSYSVGLFAAYTGADSWSATASPNFIYNQPMNIQPAADNGANALVPEPGMDRLWPNQRDADGHYHKLSFWAYYPYNATDDPGTYGIAITPTSTAIGKFHYGVTTGGGMGAIRFRMAPDASQQSDFLLSELNADCSRDDYPLHGTEPTPVPLRFHHMLAQVRIYAFIRGTDKIVTFKDDEGQPVVVTARDDTSLTLSNGQTYTVNAKDGTGWIANQWGKTVPLSVGDELPDDTPWLDVEQPKSVRWERSTTLDVTGTRFRTTAVYDMSFNNIHTECVVTPTYDPLTRHTTFTYTDVGTLGSATVQHYIMNPYWFRWANGERVMLNEHYMYNYYEETEAAKKVNSRFDGQPWDDFTTNTNAFVNEVDGQTYNDPMDYLATSDDVRKQTADPDTMRHHQGWHFNYAPGNILLCVPQVMNDNDVPHVVLSGHGYRVKYEWTTDGGGYFKQKRYNDAIDPDTGQPADAISGRVTVNMLNMNLKWEPAYIYSYAFIDNDLKPGDDKVLGPESISVFIDPQHQTDQW